MISWAKKEIDDHGEVITFLRRTDESGRQWWVPEVAGNRHYEEYLEWVAEGNEPEVIDG